jgi:hypothetical protein
MKIITKTKHKVNLAVVRLSDEEPEMLEKDDAPDSQHILQEGWLPWTFEDMIDIKRLVEQHMEEKQREVMTAFLDGLTYSDIMVTEKYWRYHFAKGVEYIKKELGL